MNPLDAQLEAILAILRSHGAVVGIDPDAPDFVKRAFLESLLSCRECRPEILGPHDGTAN